jgi:GNAT superfamily N-acetyltransferase
MSDIHTTSVDGLTIRFADSDDVQTIFDFIEQLARYERLAHEVVTDAAQLERSLFGPRKVAEVVLAEEATGPVGFALFFHNFSTFLGKPGIYLEDLFVLPDRRGRGIGRALLEFLARITVERGCGRLEWSVLDWNEPAIGFYRMLGAQSMDGWTTFRLTGESLDTLAREENS